MIARLKPTARVVTPHPSSVTGVKISHHRRWCRVRGVATQNFHSLDVKLVIPVSLTTVQRDQLVPHVIWADVNGVQVQRGVFLHTVGNVPFHQIVSLTMTVNELNQNSLVFKIKFPIGLFGQ
jgi:hypothetical protein